MCQQLLPEHEDLYRRVDEVLHFLWDPIGVSSHPEARSEYHLYLPTVFSLLTSGAKAREITDYLATVSTERMGFPDTPSGREHDQKITAILMRLRDVVHERHTRSAYTLAQRSE